LNLGTTMKTWEYKKIQFICKGIHWKKSNYTNEISQWNQGANEYHLSGGSSEILFIPKEANRQIRQYSVGISSLKILTC
jgi:hypothetical protein